MRDSTLTLRARWMVLGSILSIGFQIQIAYAGAASCIVTIISASLPTATLKITDSVKLLVAGSDRPVHANYLGYLKENGYEEVAYFYDQDNQILRVVERRDLLINNDPKLTKTVFENGSLQRLINIEAQKDRSCAAHATLNCMKFLRKNGNVTKETDAIMETNMKGLWKFIYANIAAHKLENRGLSATDQLAHQIGVLTHYGFKVAQTTLVADVIKHLKAGNPAILRAFVKGGTELFETKEGRSEGPALKPVDTYEAEGAHSALAIGYIKTGWFSGKFLVLDSNTGEIHLWEKSDVSRALRGALLVKGPN